MPVGSDPVVRHSEFQPQHRCDVVGAAHTCPPTFCVVARRRGFGGLSGQRSSGGSGGNPHGRGCSSGITTVAGSVHQHDRLDRFRCLGIWRLHYEDRNDGRRTASPNGYLRRGVVFPDRRPPQAGQTFITSNRPDRTSPIQRWAEVVAVWRMPTVFRGGRCRLVSYWWNALAPITSAAVPPSRDPTSTASVISASVAPAPRALSPSVVTPSGCAAIASVIIPISNLYLAGMAPSLRMRSRVPRYESANCGSRCSSAASHGGRAGGGANWGAGAASPQPIADPLAALASPHPSARPAGAAWMSRQAPTTSAGRQEAVYGFSL